MKKLALSVFGAAMLAASPAMAAVTLTTGPAPSSSTTVLDFDGINLLGADIVSPFPENYRVVTGTVSGQYAQPVGSVGNYVAIPATGSIGQFTLNFADYKTSIGSDISSVSFIWGSVDLYNSVDVYAGDTLLTTFLGGGVIAGNYGNQVLAGSSPMVTIGGLAGTGFNRLVLKSTQKAFEADTFSVAAVPEPSTWAMMLFGFGIVGFSMRRRRGITASFA